MKKATFVSKDGPILYRFSRNCFVYTTQKLFIYQSRGEPAVIQ